MPKTHVIELGHLSGQTSLDIAQALPIRDLRKRHAPKLFGAGECSHAVVALVAGHDPLKGGPWQKIHYLRKQGPADVHPFSPGATSRDRRKTLSDASSNRHHQFHQLTLAPACTYANDNAS
jgi:hypothetical protein